MLKHSDTLSEVILNEEIPYVDMASTFRHVLAIQYHADGRSIILIKDSGGQMTLWIKMIQKLLKPRDNGGAIAQRDKFSLGTGTRNDALFVGFPVNGAARMLAEADNDAFVRLSVSVNSIYTVTPNENHTLRFSHMFYCTSVARSNFGSCNLRESGRATQ